MDPKRMEKGVHVIIANNIDKTRKRHKANHDMLNMMGRHFLIHDVRDTSKGLAAKINGYIWHPDDLLEDSPRKEKQTFHFDEKELHP